MLRERWDEIVPADNHAVEEMTQSELARAPECLHTERWGLNLLVGRHTLVLSPVEEVLAFV